MKGFFQVIYKVHKWLGLPMLVLFAMWYISGCVMLYHRFPRLSSGEREVCVLDTASAARLWGEMPETFRSASITFSGHRPQISVGKRVIGAYTPTRADLDTIAAGFGLSVARVDTLADLDKWTPMQKYEGDLPLLRVVSPEDTYLYVSSTTGSPLQYCTRTQRFWSWLGPLPHYLYITPLRRNADAWHAVVIALSGVCTLSVLIGLVIAVRFVVKRRKLKVFGKRWWQQHFIWGLFAGVFMLMFIFSGMMSMVDFGTHTSHDSSAVTDVESSSIDPALLAGEFRDCRIEKVPFTVISKRAGKKTTRITPQGSEPDYSPEAVIPVIEQMTGEKVTDCHEVTDDIFYYSKGRPAWRAEAGENLVYWNDNGYYRVMTPPARARRICYSMLHNVRLPWLNAHPVLHDVLMWILLLSGLVITVTGGVLAFRALRR